ncbi:MAG: glycosyltransferase, partial [Gammaproteobacteria bacterium]
MSAPLRIALVTGKYPPEYSGAGLRSHNTYRRLLGEVPGLVVQVLCSGLERRRREDYRLDGIAVHRIRGFMDPQSGRMAQAMSGWAEALQVLPWLERTRPDVVHVVGACAVTAAAIAWARLRRVPLLVELVNAGASPAQSLPLLHRLWRPDLRRGTAIVAISEALAERCRELGLGELVWSRPNPVDTSRFHPDPDRRLELRRRLTPFTEEDIVLACVGKFMPLKNQGFLLDVLAQLPSAYKLVLAGPVVRHGPWKKRDQEYLERVRRKVRVLGMEGRVQLVTEFVPAEEYIRLADVYLLPSLSEGLGTPMLESLACGVPVVA